MAYNAADQPTGTGTQPGMAPRHFNRLTDSATRDASGSLVADYAYGYEPASNRTRKTIAGAASSYGGTQFDPAYHDATQVERAKPATPASPTSAKA